MRIRWRNLELPNRVTRDEESSTDFYSRFSIEPFERGFGTTVGNSLRRILLSSLEGAAVTRVKIQGAEHEFSSLPGVLEDVTEIVLNIKSLAVTSQSDEPCKMTITAGSKGELAAKHIEADANIEVINKDHHVATLTEDVDFGLEMVVEKGRGWRPAEENLNLASEVGVFPIDSSFSPVSRVRYRTEDTRVGQKTNYDRLIMEIWTNGTVKPEDALVEAANILRKHLNPFLLYHELGGDLVTEPMPAMASQDKMVDSELQAKLSINIADLELSVRANNCLQSARIRTLGELVSCTESDLLRVRSFGKTSLREVKRKLADLGLSLGMDVGDAGTPSEDEQHAPPVPSTDGGSLLPPTPVRTGL